MMGIDSSDYSFKSKEDTNTIIRLLKKVVQNTIHSKIRLTASTKQIEIAKNISEQIKSPIINIGLHFSTNDPKKFNQKLKNQFNHISSLAITLAPKAKHKDRVYLSYQKHNKEFFAYLDLSSCNKNTNIKSITDFLIAINDYSEFGPKSSDDIRRFATTMFDLNNNIRSSDKWKFDTGCLEFVPINNKRIDSSTNKYCINGLRVNFSQINAMAYKSRGVIDLFKEINPQDSLYDFNYNLVSQSTESIDLINESTTYNFNANLHYQLLSIDSILDLSYVLRSTYSCIEIDNCKFKRDDKFEFNIYITGESINELKIYLSIDYRSPESFKARVLELFENKMKHDGDG